MAALEVQTDRMTEPDRLAGIERGIRRHTHTQTQTHMQTIDDVQG